MDLVLTSLHPRGLARLGLCRNLALRCRFGAGGLRLRGLLLRRSHDVPHIVAGCDVNVRKITTSVIRPASYPVIMARSASLTFPNGMDCCRRLMGMSEVSRRMPT